MIGSNCPEPLQAHSGSALAPGGPAVRGDLERHPRCRAVPRARLRRVAGGEHVDVRRVGVGGDRRLPVVGAAFISCSPAQPGAAASTTCSRRPNVPSAFASRRASRRMSVVSRCSSRSSTPPGARPRPWLPVGAFAANDTNDATTTNANTVISSGHDPRLHRPSPPIGRIDRHGPRGPRGPNRRPAVMARATPELGASRVPSCGGSAPAGPVAIGSPPLDPALARPGAVPGSPRPRVPRLAPAHGHRAPRRRSTSGRRAPEPRTTETCLERPVLQRQLVNSLLVAAIAVPAGTLVASCAGYAIARLPRRAALLLLGVTVLAVAIPASTVFVGRLVLFRLLGVTDTPIPLVAPALIGVTPLLVLLFAWSYHTVPREIYDLATEAGLGPFGTWWHVAVPFRKGAVAVAVGRRVRGLVGEPVRSVAVHLRRALVHVASGARLARPLATHRSGPDAGRRRGRRSCRRWSPRSSCNVICSNGGCDAEEGAVGGSERGRCCWWRASRARESPPARPHGSR